MIQQRERALLSAYLQHKLPNAIVKQNCPLGIVPQSLIMEYGRTDALRFARKMRPEVDALIIEPKRLVLIEAKVIRWVDGVSKLALYKALIPDTPELEPYQGRDIVMRLVIPFTQDNMLSVAARMGVEVVEFTTPDIEKYLREDLPKYGSAEYKTKRAETLRQRLVLGVD